MFDVSKWQRRETYLVWYSLKMISLASPSLLAISDRTGDDLRREPRCIIRNFIQLFEDFLSVDLAGRQPTRMRAEFDWRLIGLWKLWTGLRKCRGRHLWDLDSRSLRANLHVLTVIWKRCWETSSWNISLRTVSHIFSSGANCGWNGNFYELDDFLKYLVKLHKKVKLPVIMYYLTVRKISTTLVMPHCK